ncbi:MAG: hypothetical protein U0230_25620 [Polyangiales bacterium]
MIPDRDRRAIESLVLDPEAEPSFEFLKSCLVWPDEISADISPPGYDFLADLLVYRGFVHRRKSIDELRELAGPYKRAWAHALETGLRWPGFQRLELSPRDRAYLERCLAEVKAGGGL